METIEYARRFVKDGWMLNPNEKVVVGIVRGIQRNNGECPCDNPYKGTFDAVCPCKSYRIDDKCCCNLYVKKK